MKEIITSIFIVIGISLFGGLINLFIFSSLISLNLGLTLSFILSGISTFLITLLIFLQVNKED